MKKNRHWSFWKICCIIGISLLIHSCKKENFNFDRLDNIEASGEWGIPIANARYSVQRLLSQFNDNGYIEQDANGNLIFKYEVVLEDHISAAEFMVFDNINISERFEFDNTYLPGVSVTLPYNGSVSFDNNMFELDEGIIKTGFLDITIQTNVSDNYTITLTFPEIQDPNGNTLELQANSQSGDYSTRVDMRGYTIRPLDANEITYTGSVSFVTGSDPSITRYFIDFSLSSTNVSLQYISGKMAPYTVNINEKMNFDFFSPNYGGAITIYNPNISLHTKSSFVIDGQYIIDTAEFLFPGGSSSLLVTSPTSAYFPPGPYEEYISRVETRPDITLSTDFESVNITGKVVVHPDGFSGANIQIYDNSTISSKIVVSIPFTVKAENLFYRDTIDFNFNNLSNTDIMEYIQFRIALSNALPFDMNFQAYFHQSTTNTMVDSLFNNRLVLPGHYSDQNNVQEVVRFEDVTSSRIERISNADKVILDFKINTADRVITLKNSDYLKAIFGMKLKYNTNDVLISEIL